jgi:AraC-like DNA-binding protein
MMSWLIFAGAVQGVFLSFFLLKTERGHLAGNKVLACYLGLLSYYLLVPELVRNYYETLPHLLGTTFPLLYLIGPGIYLYTHIILEPRKITFRKFSLHLIPAIVSLVYFIPFFIQSKTDKLEFLKSMRLNGLSFDFALFWMVACAHIILYNFLSYRKVHHHNHELKNFYSKIESIRLGWLQYLSLWSFILWSLYFIGYCLVLLKVELDPLGSIDKIFSIALTFFIYYLSYEAMNNAEVFPGSILSAIPNIKSVRSNLSAEKRMEYVDRLSSFMNSHKPYLNSTLTLEELAKMIDLSPRLLSQIINEEHKQSFFDYINSQRVEEVKKKLIDRNNNHLTIVALAMDSGFNSKSTFNEVFKKLGGVTPSVFKKLNQK